MKKKAFVPVGASLIVMSSVFFASYGIWTQLIGNFLGGYTASAIRSAIVLLLLVPIAIFYKKLEPIKWKQNWPYLLGMFFASLFVWGPLYFAVLNGGIGISLTINYACIVIGVFIFGWIFLGERFTKDKLVAAVLGIVGLIFIYAQSVTGIAGVALMAASVSGLAIAANTVLAKKLSYKSTQSTIALWVTGVVANIVMMALLQESMPALGWRVEWLYLVAFAAASVIASWAFMHGLKLIDAGIAGILGLLEIVFSVAFGIIFFHERPGYMVFIGAIIIIVAASIPYIKEFRDSLKPLRID